MGNKKIPIIRKDGVAIYGEEIDPISHKMGNYTVESEMYGYEETIYSLYSDAEKRTDAIFYAMSKNQAQKKEKVFDNKRPHQDKHSVNN